MIRIPLIRRFEASERPKVGGPLRPPEGHRKIEKAQAASSQGFQGKLESGH